MSDVPDFPSPSIIDSRRLTGPNVFSPRVGAVLEVQPGASPETTAAWAAQVRQLTSALEWRACETRERRSASLVVLFFEAPADVLMTATEVSEQAWVRAESGDAVLDEALVARLETAAAAERALHPNLAAVYDAALVHDRSVTFDDECVTLGSGAGSRTWPLAELPPLERIPWDRLRDVPIALVTGSNGKTTTVRLVAAMWAAVGRPAGWSCSDGVWIGGEQMASGDYSGPVGAREVLRSMRVDAAVLETARGGILRRGLATTRANVAIITNVSADHFGEYGIDSLAELAEVKSVVARVLGDDGCLVLNADDPALAAMDVSTVPRVAWFSVAAQHPVVDAHAAAGGLAATIHDGRGVLHLDGRWHDVGRVAGMPVTLDGAAAHNVANALGAALVGAALGIPPDAIRGVLKSFGASPRDNPGRLQVSKVGGVTVLTDYAHNPDGLAALCATAASMPARRRLLVLGQAGNRGDEHVRDLARAALAVTKFDCVVVKEMPTMLRGRALGELTHVLRDELLLLGMKATQVQEVEGEREAVRQAMAWAKGGDLLVCPVHAEREAVHSWLEVLAATGWRAGDPVPD